MFEGLFTALRDAKIPVSMKEWLHLMEAMDRDVAGRQVEAFYHLSRAVLVKDERHYDRFDQVFGTIFKGVETVGERGVLLALAATASHAVAKGGTREQIALPDLIVGQMT
jgi:uncharacterized protein with von Willebrand factor type A (vWA) domain